MKTFYKHASDFHPAFSEIENAAFNAGYNMSIMSDSDSIKMMITQIDESSIMPNIQVHTVCIKDSVVFEPSVSFPTLVYTTGSASPDSIQYWIKKWEQVGKFITNLNTFQFCPADYKE